MVDLQVEKVNVCCKNVDLQVQKDLFTSGKRLIYKFLKVFYKCKRLIYKCKKVK